MGILSRLYSFTASTKIVSAQVNAEFDQIVELLNGANETDSVYIGSSTPPTGGTPKLLVQGQVFLQADPSGAVLQVYKVGDALASPRMTFNNTGAIRCVASQNTPVASTQTITLSGVLEIYSDYDGVGNVGTGEDTLGTITINANTLGSTSLHSLRIRAYGYTAANANNKTIKFKVGSSTVLNTGAVAFNNKNWYLEVDIFRVTNAHWLVCGKLVCDTTIITCNVNVGSMDATVDNTLTLTGTATSDDDIVLNAYVVEKNAKA